MATKKQNNDNAKQGTTAVKVESLIEPIITDLGLRLWEVRFEKEGPDWFLRIFIDADEPIDMQKCEEATRAINPIIDEADPIQQSYYMEVGGPGLGRKLTKQQHFDLMQGKRIKVHFIRADKYGAKEMAGTLLKKEKKLLAIDTDGKELEIDMADVSFVKLYDDEMYE